MTDPEVLPPLAAYVASLTTEQEHALAAFQEAQVDLAAITEPCAQCAAAGGVRPRCPVCAGSGLVPVPIATKGDYEAVADLLKKVTSKRKFLDDERKVTVTPLNAEVDRVNAWFKPALDAFARLRGQAETLLSAWILKQRAEERRLMDEAAAAATIALNTAPSAITAPIAAATATLVTAAAAMVPAKVAGVSAKPVWKWVVTDEASLPRAFLMRNDKALAAHVLANGNKNVPSGVEVTEDVSFRVR